MDRACGQIIDKLEELDKIFYSKVKFREDNLTTNKSTITNIFQTLRPVERHKIKFRIMNIFLTTFEILLKIIRTQR